MLGHVIVRKPLRVHVIKICIHLQGRGGGGSSEQQ